MTIASHLSSSFESHTSLDNGGLNRKNEKKWFQDLLGTYLKNQKKVISGFIRYIFGTAQLRPKGKGRTATGQQRIEHLEQMNTEN
jgi:hypothetical protein